MNSKVNFHPSGDLLQKFATGGLSGGMNVAISAHVELCDSCRQQTSKFEAQAANEWSQTETESVDSGFDGLIADIVQHPQFDAMGSSDSALNEIHMLDHSVRLPKVLAKVSSEGLVWKQLGGGINQAELVLDDETQCEFIYMKPGSQTPVHKHQGSEVTLVLDGSFSDELGHYKPSDFVVRTVSDIHQPSSEEGCLCFAVLDKPLTFTKGIARLLNPINNYRFRRSLAQRAS